MVPRSWPTLDRMKSYCAQYIVGLMLKLPLSIELPSSPLLSFRCHFWSVSLLPDLSMSSRTRSVMDDSAMA